MLVLDQRIEARLALGAADREDRHLALERHECLEHERRGAERGPRGVDVGLRAQHPLALAVVAEATRLQHGGEAEPSDGAIEIVLARDRREAGGGNAQRREEALLVEPILAHLERARRRIDANELVQEARGADRHVLELVRDDVALPRQLAEPLLVVVRANPQVADVPSRRLRAGVEEHEALAERVAGERDHPSELASAENADRHDVTPSPSRHDGSTRAS